MADPINEALQWTLGLRASNGKYITVETFGDQISVTSPTMRKKQIFTLEQNETSPVVYLRTPNGKYLSSTAKGALSAGATSKGKDEEWTIIPQNDGTWALKSAHNNYLRGSDSAFDADGRDVGISEKWIVHLAMHPQVVIRNVGRRAYMHLEGEEVNLNELIPWGFDSMITIEFHDGRYAFRTANNKYLHKSGSLNAALDDGCKFIIVFQEGQLAFRDNDGNYLQGYGPKGKVQSKRNQIGKNELFELEDSHPQGILKSAQNGKICSIKQGTDVKATASEDEPTDTEIWQMEICANGKWVFRTHKGIYWTLANGFISATASGRVEDAQFEVTFHDAYVNLKANNGKFVGIKPNGSLSAALDAPDDTAKFYFNIINRPQIVLRCEYGFVATKAGNILNCASSKPDVYHIQVKDGVYSFKGPDGWWNVQPDGFITAAGSAPEGFYLSMPVYTKWYVKSAKNGKYVKGEHQGNFKACEDAPTGKDDLWEY